MKYPTLPAGFLIAALCGGLILASGCSEEEIVPSGGYVEVRVVALNPQTGDPAAGVKVILMDRENNQPVAGPLVTGEEGQAYFGGMKAGPWHLIAFGGVDYQIYSLPAGLDVVQKGMPKPSLVSPNSKTSPAPYHELVVGVFSVAQDSLPRIAGTVFDTELGTPLDRVFVSLSPELTGYQGETTASDDVTLADGAYSVAQIPFGLDPDTENIVQIIPLRFTRNGYRPIIYTHSPPNGSNDVDFRGVLIGMERLAPGDTASIGGRLLRDGVPVSGVVVGLGVAGLPDGDKAGPGMPGWTGITDDDGRYLIEDLPAGTYTLQPGFAVGDGVFFPNQAGYQLVELQSGQAAQTNDLIVWHEITSVYPRDGSVLSTPPDSLRWTPVPGAGSYEVRFNRGVLPRTTTTAIALPDSLVVNSDRHLWFVLAYDSTDELVGATQIPSRFLYDPSPP